MSSSNDNLVLHLKLDAIIQDGGTNKLIDVSSQKNNSTIQGNLQIVADETFCSCLIFDGNDANTVVLPAASIPPGNEITVSFWASPSSVKKGNKIFYAGTSKGDRLFNVHLPWSDKNIYFDCGCNSDGSDSDYDRIGKLVQQGDFQGQWNHWTFTKDAAIGEMKIYLNGNLWHSDTGKSKPIVAASTVNLGRNYDGRIANIRIYNQALSSEEIKRDIDNDLSAIASFNKTHPLDFNLYEGENKEPVIFIENGTKGQELILEIVNDSGQTIYLPPNSGGVSRTNYHFELRFRPDTLSPNSLQKLALQPNKNWSMSSPVSQSDGLVSLYFLNTNDQPLLNANHTESLTIQNLNGAAAGGARTTRAELMCPQFTYQGEPFNNYYREKSLSIVSHRGKKNIPLHVGFVGSNRILNDGTSQNTLILRITNVLKDRAIPFNPASSGDQASKLIISFDTEFDWALGTTDQVAKITISSQSKKQSKDWQIKQDTEGESPIWTITNDQDTGLAAGQVVQLTIDNIISSLSSGNTNLYLRYENIPGYWDGTFISTIEKMPILYDDKGNVGIGTTNLDGNKLKVQGDTTIAGNLNIAAGNLNITNSPEDAGQLNILGWEQGWNIQAMTPGKDLYLNRDSKQKSNVYIGVNTKELFVRGTDGNVGIGTYSPREKLQVAGNVYISGSSYLQFDHSYGNDDDGKIGNSLFAPGLNLIGINNDDTFRKVQLWGEITQVENFGTNTWSGDNCFNGKVQVNSLQIGSTVIGEKELQILLSLAAGELQVDIYNTDHQEYLYAASDYFDYDTNRRRVFTWNTQDEQVGQGRWRLDFPGSAS